VVCDKYAKASMTFLLLLSSVPSWGLSFQCVSKLKDTLPHSRPTLRAETLNSLRSAARPFLAKVLLDGNTRRVGSGVLGGLQPFQLTARRALVTRNKEGLSDRTIG
jgi:hypothetical protein